MACLKLKKVLVPFLKDFALCIQSDGRKAGSDFGLGINGGRGMMLLEGDLRYCTANALFYGGG